MNLNFYFWFFQFCLRVYNIHTGEHTNVANCKYVQKYKSVLFISYFVFHMFHSYKNRRNLSKVMDELYSFQTLLSIRTKIWVSNGVNLINFFFAVLTRWRNSLSDSRSSWRSRILSCKEKKIKYFHLLGLKIYEIWYAIKRSVEPCITTCDLNITVFVTQITRCNSYYSPLLNTSKMCKIFTEIFTLFLLQWRHHVPAQKFV